MIVPGTDENQTERIKMGTHSTIGSGYVKNERLRLRSAAGIKQLGDYGLRPWSYVCVGLGCQSRLCVRQAPIPEDQGRAPGGHGTQKDE